MAYNRCVGTRYCANNCPYKVRRFNFLEYTVYEDAETRDAWSTTPRSRCVRAASWRSAPSASSASRTQDRAKSEGRRVRDGEIDGLPQACPAEAIVFGDLKDPESRVAKLSSIDRGYRCSRSWASSPRITYLGTCGIPPPEGGRHDV